MDGQPPLDELQNLGYTSDPVVAIFPPSLLDGISTCRSMAREVQDGVDLLAHETPADPRGVFAHHPTAGKPPVAGSPELRPDILSDALGWGPLALLRARSHTPPHPKGQGFPLW